jgi:hypothetical protein
MNLFHYPAVISNSSIATEVAKFGPAGAFTQDTTAAVINTFGSRQQMVFFLSWGAEWSLTTAYLQHVWVHWMTRGLCKDASPCLEKNGLLTVFSQSSESGRLS